MVSIDARVEGIRSVLVHLRTRSGLSVDRLRTTEVNVQPIFDLPVVRNVIRATGGDPAEAAVVAMRQLASRLGPTDMLIVDAALALGLLLESDGDRTVHEPLYDGDLGRRRDWLVEHWQQLHESCGANEVPPRPSVRNLRTNLEPRALERLAQRCVSTFSLDADARDVGARDTDPADSVAVVGGAVMDHIVVADHFPVAGTSVQASAFVRHPGGKALNQAVAMTRLGLPVHLIAAVGDDPYGEEILHYLQVEGLRTDLIKRVPSARSPIAVVAVDQTGGSAGFGWMNKDQVRLDPADIGGDAVRAAIEGAAVVLMTFEASTDALRTVFDLTRDAPSRLILHPSPPLITPQLLYEHLSDVDYLVGSSWELRHLLPDPSEPVPTDDLATQLLLLGVGAVCVVENFGCLLRSNEWNEDIPRLRTPLSDAPGARDAFSAALTRRIVSTDDQLTESDLAWAVAAMAARSSFRRIPTSMPTTDDIGHIVAALASPTPDMKK